MRILIAEDDPVSRRHLSRILTSWDYEVLCASDGEQAWSTIAEKRSPSLMILDWEMPGRDGVDICRELRSLKREPYPYIILLTARKHREDLIKGMKSGADDYLTKPFDRHELKARLRAGRRILSLQEELIRAREVMTTLALYDDLTGIPNRGAILTTLRMEFERARRNGSSLAVIMADVDHFKTINDTFGHLVGDDVLRDLSLRLRREARVCDSVGRYGGEEFLIVVPDCDESNVLKPSRRYRNAIRSRAVRVERTVVPVTMSFGVSVYSGQQNVEVGSLIQAADDALYRAKERGRDRIELGRIESGPPQSAIEEPGIWSI